MSALNYTTRWPRGNARTAANKAIRLGLPGGDQILDASKLLTDAVRSSAGGAHYEQAMRLLSSGMASIEAHGASDLIVGIRLLRRSRNAPGIAKDTSSPVRFDTVSTVFMMSSICAVTCAGSDASLFANSASLKMTVSEFRMLWAIR